MKKIINKADYEVYDFDYFNLIKKYGRGASFDRGLLRELEKVHPCFSDNYSIEKRKAFVGKKLVLKVIVIDREKLKEYQKNNRTYIYIDEKKRNVPVFNKDNYLRIMKASCAAMVLFSVIGMLLLTKSALFAEENSSIESVNTAIKTTEEKKSLLQILLDMINKDENIFERISYQLNNGKEIVSVGFKNVYSNELLSMFENIIEDSQMKINISETVYNENIPRISINVERNTSDATEKSVITNCIPDNVRNSILQCNGKLKKEENNNVNFEIGKSKINKLFSCLNENNICYSEIEIVDAGNSFDVNMCSDSIGVNTNTLLSSLKYFDCKEKKSVENLAAKNLAVKKEEKNQEKIFVGKISRADGSSVEYYKLPDGKIIAQNISKGR